MNAKRKWRGPTIAEIAKAAGVGTATVDRVLNGRDSVREGTKEKVLAALASLKGPDSREPGRAQLRRITFICDSGSSFNQSLEQAVQEVAAAKQGIDCSFDSVTTPNVEPIRFAQMIERRAGDADGLVVVAREGPVINRALKAVAARHVPIICLTTDLPNSGRVAYVGNDQTSAGATAAYLMGRLVGRNPSKILLVISAPYRVQEEREVGFRRVLRSEFTHLEVEDRVNSNDDVAYSYEHVSRYIEEHGPPAGIYNVAAGNVGIGRALETHDLIGKTVFIGHELNPNSHRLLETGQMDVVIGHDVENEVALSIDYLLALLDRKPLPSITPTKVRIFTKFNCS